MTSGGATSEELHQRDDDPRVVRASVRKVAPSNLRIFAVPLVFFAASYGLTALEQADVINGYVQMVVFGVLAVIAFLVTIKILASCSVLRRGHRLSAPALVIYLVAVRVAIYANQEWGVGAVLAVFLLTMAVLAVYSSIVRREERPKSVTYADLSSVKAVLPFILLLNEVDRIERPLLAAVLNADTKTLDTTVSKLEKAAYVNLTGSDERPFVTPTAYLRRSARDYRRRNQMQVGRPGWLKGKTR